MSLLEKLPHECSIFEINRGRDALGGSNDTEVPIRTGVECWEQSSSNTRSVEFQKRGFDDTRRIYFASDPGVEERHSIKVTKRNNVVVTSPISYSVMSEATPDASAGLGVLWRVEVNRMSGENQ